jgi:hypothetical protein
MSHARGIVPDMTNPPSPPSTGRPASRRHATTGATTGSDRPGSGSRGGRPFRTVVRGHAFAAAPPGADALDPGLSARAVREPDNPADPLAVAIWAQPGEGAAAAWRIGYLDRVVAARLAPRLDAGVRVEVEVEGLVPEPDGRWQRPVVRLRLEEPARSGLWGRPPGVTRRPVRG